MTNKTKYLIYMLFGVTAVVLVVLLVPQKPRTSHEDNALLWKIEKPGYKTSYLLGTVHSSDPRILNLPQQVIDALDDSDRFAAEIDLNPETIISMQKSLLLPKEQSLKDMLGEERYQRMIKVIQEEYELPEFVVSRLKPWAIYAIMQQPKERLGGVALDIKLYKYAREHHKELHGLETVEEQLKLFDDMSLDDHLKILDYSLDNHKKLLEINAQLIDLYVARDLNGIFEMSKQLMDQGFMDFNERFQTDFIDKRNHVMAERMQPLLKQGRAFIAVGALHLPGDTGLIKLLRDRGFTLTPVY